MGLAALAPLLPTPLAGQVCPDGAISGVVIANHSIYDPQELQRASRFRWAYALANSLHVRTREDFIRRELLFVSGDCYDPLLLTESERLLRRYRFLARADVEGLRQPDGSWRVVVSTQDEWTTRVSVQGSVDGGPRLERVGVVEQNLLGRGILVGGSIRTLAGDDDVAARTELPRVLGTRARATLRWAQVADGDGYLSQSLTYPFIGEIGRVAASQTFLRRESWFAYSAGAGLGVVPGPATRVYLPFEEERLEVTFAGRLGPPGNLTIVGLGFSNETLDFPAYPRRVEVAPGESEERIGADSAMAAVMLRQTEHAEGTHVNLMIAQRNIRFEEFRGLDALRGTFDAPIGVYASLLLGRGVGALSTGADQPDDLYSSLRAEWSASPGPLLLIAAGGAEGRRLYAGGRGRRWNDVLAELTGLAYWQPGALPRHTFLFRGTGAGGWSLTQPFQLTLGGYTGVRGYRRDDFPGGRRVVLNAEDRIYLGWPNPDLFDLGVTLLADVGRIWPGDAPFGRDSGWRGTIGAGIRLGFPAGSRRVGRIDLAWPVSADGIARTPHVRFAIGDPIGITAGLADRQIARTRVDLAPDRFVEHLR